MRDGASIFVLMDGLGWEVLRERPFLDDLLPDRHPVETILGYSSGAIPTLLTGVTPAVHGHWNLFYRSPRTSPFRWTGPLGRLPRALRENRVVRRGVAEVSRRLSGYTGYFAIYNLPVDRMRFYDICETTDIYRPGGIADAPSLFDRMEAQGEPYECFNYHRHTDEQILDLVPLRLKESPARTYFLYLAGLDLHLHLSITDEKGVTERLAWYAERLRRVYAAARARWGSARMHLFSDHGMTRVEGGRDLMGEVARLGLRIPQDYLPAYDSTMARFWADAPAAQRRLRELLGALPYGRLLDQREMAALGLAFEDDRYGQLVFVMKPGLTISPSDMGRVQLEGMHGFHPHEDPHAAAVFLSSERGPAVRHLTGVLPRLLADFEWGRREEGAAAWPRAASAG
ncbi:MAG TPA: alkaline phosphatase family protein [Vicinamibacteria bacterium]